MTDSDLNRALAYVAAARALHVPSLEHDCEACGRQWPCDTAKALGRPRVEMVVRWDA